MREKILLSFLKTLLPEIVSYFAQHRAR